VRRWAGWSVRRWGGASALRRFRFRRRGRRAEDQLRLELRRKLCRTFVGTLNLLPIRGRFEFAGDYILFLWFPRIGLFASCCVSGGSPAFGYSIPIPIPTPTPSGQSIRVDSCSLAVGMVRTEGLNREWTRLGKSEVRNSKPETNSKHERGRNVQNPERWFMERADRRAVNFVSNFVGNFIAHFIGNRSPRR
jgi:hypothetical protein